MTFIVRLFQHLYSKAAIMVFSLAFSAVSANALEKEQATSTLDKIYQAQIHSYYSINGFYNFSANRGDQQQLKTIEDSVSKIDDLIGSLKGWLSDSANAQKAKLTIDEWKVYHEILDQNIVEVNKNGYPDLRLLGDMAAHNIRFNQILEELYNAISQDEAIKPSEVTTTSHQSAITLALMMTKYSARSTSTVSQVYAGDDTEITIDSLAKEFRESLNRLSELTHENNAAHDLLNSAKTQWEFIHSSYTNYNDNRVNFIVNMYSKKIISDLESVSAAF